MPRTAEQYAAYLSSRRDTLAQFRPETDELSYNNQPSNATMADSHRKLIIAAFLDACGNPADGRWTRVVHLCRLGITQGRHRWLGTRAEKRAQTPGGRGQSKGRTASRRLNEGKGRNEQCLRQKVESWQIRMTQEMALKTTGANTGRTPTRRDKSESTFLGFKVAKRTTLTSARKTSRLNGTKPASPKQQTTGADLVCALATYLLVRSNALQSYLPPSFPSHLATSTPQRPERRKPPSTPSHSSSSNLVSPEKVQLYDGTFASAGNQGLDGSLPTRTLVQSAPARLPTFAESKIPNTASRQSDHQNSSYDFSLSNTRSPNKHRVSKTDVLLQDINGGAEPRPQVHNLGLLNDNDKDDFDPPFTSTQKDGDAGQRAVSKTFGDHQWMGFSSQLAVDRRVGEVAKLLEKDVEWYRKS
ncbi:hypothetical protein AX15_000255 [Amanita polypyramis BW_CC]|nr:hypothetical protein AX15_000255 [Amanita polypyramis BW_CC]